MNIETSTTRATIIVPEDNRKKTIGIIAGVALATGIGGLLIGRSIGGDAPAPAAAAIAAPVEGAEHAEEGGEEHPEGLVEITPVAATAAGIVTEVVSEGTIASEIIAQASVTAPPEGRASLTARADGAVTRITKRLGDPVGAGETIALIESRDASAIVAERASATARATAANAALNRERRLFAERITARQIQAARRAITRHIKRQGRLWIRIFPDVPVSSKPAEVRMGSGKGAP